MGDPLSLAPYREQLTGNEVRHLLCKFALCGTPDLYNIGVQYGRTALVNALLNYESEPRLAAERTRIRSRLGGLSVEDYALGIAWQARGGACGSLAPYNWTPETTQYYWFTYLANGSPLRENIALLLGYHIPVNFAVNLDGGIGGGCSSGWTYKSYVDLLRVHALGRTPITSEERPVTSSFKGLLSDLLQDYQMGLYLNHIQPWVIMPSGFGDWLPGLISTNFGRELLQVFSLGQYNVYDGRANYTEHDVEQVSESLAGNVNPFAPNAWDPQPVLNQVTELKQTPWRLDPAINEGRFLKWSPAYRQVGQKTIFENESSPVRKTGDLVPSDVLDSIARHEGFAYIARMLFNRTVYQLHASMPAAQGTDGAYTSLLSSLDQNFRANDLRIAPYIGTLLNSSAAFSTKARNACIPNGTVHLTRLLHLLQLPVTQYTSDATYPGGTFYETFARLMAPMNDVLGSPPSIFGYNECGDTDGTPDENNYGQAQLMTQEQLGKFNLPFELMNYYLEGNVWWYDHKGPQEGFTVDQLFPTGVLQPSPSQLISYFEGLFGVTLSSAERTIVMNFLDPTDGSRPRYSTTAALPAQPLFPNETKPAGSLMRSRVALLVTIFSNLADVVVR